MLARFLRVGPSVKSCRRSPRGFDPDLIPAEDRLRRATLAALSGRLRSFLTLVRSGVALFPGL